MINNKILAKIKSSNFSIKIFTIIILSIFGCQFNKNTTTKARYVITSPEIAEIISLLGKSDSIVGITAECDFPASLKEIPKVGLFGDVSFEKIIELNPTVVFTSGLEQDKISSDLRKIEIRVESVYSQSIDEMYESILRIGKIVDAQERALVVIDSIKQEINQIKSNQPVSKLRVYVEIYGDPIMSVSDSSFVGNLVEISGANNVFDYLPRSYSVVSQEKVIEADPQIIILAYPRVDVDDLVERKGWGDITAVKNRKIYNINDLNPDYLIRTTPRVILGLKKLQEIYSE